MLTLPSRPGPVVRPHREWQMVSADEAAGMIRTGNTVAVGWLGDAVASAMQAAMARPAEARETALSRGRVVPNHLGVAVRENATGGLGRQLGIKIKHAE